MTRPVLLALCLVPLGVAAKPAPPTVPYWHNWTDGHGVSHMTRCEMRSFALQSMSPPADPQWQDRQPPVTATVIATVQPDGWTGTWHQNPRVQWIVPLEGTWFVEAMDGTRVELGPGEMTLGEDLHTTPDAAGRRGHLSGNIGRGPVTLLVIQLDTAATIDRPCRVR